MPNDDRTQAPNNDGWHDPLDDLISPILDYKGSIENNGPTPRPVVSRTKSRDPLDDLLTDADVIAESRIQRPQRVEAKRLKRNGLRLKFLVGTLAAVTGLLIFESFEPGVGRDARRVAPTPVKDQSSLGSSADSQIALGTNFGRFLDKEGLSPTGSASPAAQRRTNLEEKTPRSIEDSLPRTPEELFKQVSPSVVRVNVRNAKAELIGIGSGFFVRDDSTVVTNFHVIEGADFVEIILHDGRESVSWEVESFDEASDVAILHVRHAVGTVVRPLPLSLEMPAVASRAYVIGAPKGLDHSFSEGSVSGRREIDGRTWVQTTAPISPGSSGSPLFSDKGVVVGMATRFRVDGQNLNFAIASRHIHDLLPNRDKSSLVTLSELPSRRPPQKQTAAPAKPAEPLKLRDDENGLKEAERHIAAGVNRRALQVLDDIPADNRGPKFWRVRATALFSLAKYHDAANCYAESLRLDNRHSDTWIRYATALRLDSLNNKDNILAACRAALKIDPNDARAYHVMGLTFLEKDERIDAFKTALSIDEADLGTHYHLGCAFVGKKTGDIEARKHFKRALALIADAEKYQVVNPESQRFEPGRLFDQPNTIASFSDRDSLEVFLKLQLASVSEPEERIAICRDVLKSEPDNDVATISLGMAFRGLGFSRKDANMMRYGDALQAKFRNELGSVTLLKEVSLSAGTTGILVFRK